MSGSPSRPTPPSRPQSISHEGITISGVRVAPILQGTCSQDHWLLTGRPHLGGYMSPGGSFALSASTSRSSGSAAAVRGTRGKGRADMAAQDKIHSSGSRSPPTPEQSGSKMPTWRSFSAGSCNWSFNAQLRPSRHAVRDGSEFKFSLRSSRSPSSSSDGSLHYSMLAPDDASIPRNQDSMVSVQLRPPKSPSGSVEYACTASPSRTANVLPGSPLRRTALDTKVSTRVITTTVAWTPPAHAIGLTPRRSSVSGMSSREMLKSDKQEEQRRRSVTFTGAPLMAAVPENSLREVTTINSTIPESKSRPPQEQSEFPVPKTIELQNLEPRLGPPQKEDKEAERVSSVDVRLKPGSEPSKSFQDIGAPKEPVKSEGLQSTSKRHWRSTAGHTPSAALVLKDESEQNTTLGAARPQPAPAGVSVAKEVSPAEVSDEDDSAPIATMNVDVPISKPDYQPSVLLSQSGRNETEATEMTVAAPPLSADQLESQREEKRKREASALVEIDKEDRSIRAARDAEESLLYMGTLFGPKEHVITDNVKATLSPTTVIETPPSNQRLKSGEGVETMKRADTKAFGSRAFEEGSTRPEKRESDELAEDTNVDEIFAEAETYLHGSKMEERTKHQSHERATFSEQEPQAEPKTNMSDEIQAQPGAPAKAPEVDRRENRGDAQAATGRHLEQAESAVQVYEGTLTKSAQDSDTVPEQVEAPQAPVQTKIALEALPYDEVSASSPVDLVIEENRVSGERTDAAGPRELEAKTDIQLPEITHELPIRPRTTGGSLEGESRITDHAKHDRTKSREECSLARSFDKSGETRTLGEVSEAQKEIEPTEVLEIPTEETAAATEALARDKFAYPIKADSAAQTVRPKPITDIRSPGIEDEHSMHSRPMGGLFERGRIIAETVEREEIKVGSETGPWKFAHISRKTTAEASKKHEGATETNKIKAIADGATHGGQIEPQVQHEAAVLSTAAPEYVKPKPKGDLTPPKIGDEHSLFQRATEGLLESKFHPTEQANHQGIKTSAPETLLAPSNLVHKPEEEKMSVKFSEPRVEARVSLNKPAYEAETATAEASDHDDVRAPVASAHVPDNFSHASKHETWPPHIQAFFLKSTATGALLKEDSSIMEHAKNGETNAVMARSEEAKDATDGLDAEPYYLSQMPEEKRAFVEVGELQRGGRRTPASESTTAKIEEDARREPKPVARPPEIQEEFFLAPRVTGGLLEQDNAIIEHATSDKDDVSEAESVAELYILVHVTEPTTALVEVGEPDDKAKITVTEPTNEGTMKSLMRESKSKLNRQMPEIEDEFFLQPRVTGGLLEKDGTDIEYARSEEVKPDMDGSEIKPYYFFHMSEKKRAFVEVGELHRESTKTSRSESSANGAAENAEREPKLDARLSEIKEFFHQPTVTGGCLEVYSMITDHGKPEGVQADVDGSGMEPYYFFHMAEQKRAFVKVGELHREGRMTQGSESSAEVAAENVKHEPKLDGRPPEIERDWFLQPYVTGCCLEVDSVITDHETSEGVKADVDGSEIEPYYLFHMPEEKRAFVEVAELHGEGRWTLGSESSTEGAADYVEREPKLDGCLPEIKREFFLSPNVTGGCLEVNSMITNHDKSEGVEADEDKSNIEPYYLFHMREEKRAFGEVGELHEERRTPGSESDAEGAAKNVEREPKLETRLHEISRELSLQHGVMGGYLEGRSSSVEATKHVDEDKPAAVLAVVLSPISEKHCERNGLTEPYESHEDSKAEEEPKGVTSSIETAALVRRSLGDSTAAKDAGGRDAKAGRQRQSLIARISLGPMVTGGLLEKESSISEHVKSDEAITAATILTEPCTLRHTHGEFVTSVEAHKPTEIKAVEEISALIEATSSAAEAVPEVACEAPTETHLSELSKSVAKVDDEGHAYGEELFLNPRVAGGLLDVVQVVPQRRSALVDEPSIVSRMKPSGAAVSPRVLPEEFLWTYPMVTGGLLEFDVFICGGASGPEQKTPMSCEKRERDKSSLKDFIATERTVSAHQTSTSHVGERALAGPAGPAVAPCTSDTDVCGILAEKLAPAHYAQVTPLPSSRKLSDDQSKTQPAKTPGGVELPKSRSGAAFNTDTPFAFSAAKRSLIDTSSEIQLPSSALKQTLSWTLVQDIFNTSTRTEEKPTYIDSRIPFCGTQYDADFTYRASTSSKTTDKISNPKEKMSVTPQDPWEVELGFVPTTDMDVAVKDKSSHSDLLSTPVEQHLPSVERGILPVVSSEHHHSSDERPLDNTREQMPERKEPVKESEEGGGKAKPEEAEDVSYKSNEQVGSEKALGSPAFPKLDSDSSALADGGSCFSDSDVPKKISKLIQKKQADNLFTTCISKDERELRKIIQSKIKESNKNIAEHRKEVSGKEGAKHVGATTTGKYEVAEVERSMSKPNLEEQVPDTRTAGEVLMVGNNSVLADREVLKRVPTGQEPSSQSLLLASSVDVRTSATSLEHNLPTFDEHRVQSDVAATERTLHTAHEAGMVEARNADERLEMASEQKHASDKTTTEEKVPLALTRDMHPVISETIAQHEHSSSLSTTSENDKSNSPAESENFRPEGIPDPVASLVAFFEQRGSAHTTDRKLNIPSDESNGAKPLEKQRNLSESKREPETYTAIHSKESIMARADAWASPPLVTEKRALPENASAASNEGGILEGNKSTEEIPQAEETRKTEASEIDTDANTPPKVVEVAMTGTELHEDKCDSSAKVPSSKEIEGRQSPPAVAEEGALPVAVTAEHEKDKALTGCGKVQHTGGYNRITKAVPSIAEVKRSPGDKDVHMTSAEESKMKPTPSAEAQSMQKLGGSQSPLVVTELRALPDDATAVPPKHGEQEGLGATVKMQHTGGESYMIKKVPSAAESKQYPGEKDSNLTSTKVSEKKPHSSEKGQHLKGPQSSRGLTKEDAHPEVTRVVSAGEIYERDKKGLNTGEENSVTVVLPSAVSGEKNQHASRTETVLRKPPILGRDESAVVVEGWQRKSAAIEKHAPPDDQSSTHKDLQHQSLSSEEWANENVMTVTEAATDERIIGKLKESPSYSRLLKTKNEMQEEHGGTVSHARTFKFTTPAGTLDYSLMNDLNTGVIFTTIKSASSYIGSPRRRKEKADNADEEFVYLSSGSSSPRGELTLLKKRSSCRLVRIADDCGNEISPTTANSPPGSPAKQYFKAFFQQGQAALYTGDLTKPHAPSKLTNRLTSNISCNDDSSPSHRSEKKKTGRDEQDAQTRDPYDESAHPSRSSLPSERKENIESNISKSRLLRADYAHSAVWPPKISPPHHDTKVLSILHCKLCGQSVFRGNPTHAEMCSSYHRDSAVPPATSGVPPTPQFLEKYVLSVVDEDDVSDVLRQAWRDEDIAILAPSVWSLYHCAPSFFYIIREKAIQPSSRGEVCASACIITFGDEVSFCGFFHISRERDDTGLSRTLWNRMLHACQGKNVCSAMPQARALPFLRRYHFLVSYWGDIVYCHVTLRGGSFPAPSASRDGLLVRDLDLKRDSEAVIEYDHGVFGFDRSYYLRVALAEKEQTVKVATVASSEGHVTVAGYAGVQTDERGRPALRWLFADGDEAALALMHAVVEACPKIREKGLVGAFYAASHATGVILNSVNKKFMEPWILLYNTREPFLRYDKIVSLTLI